MQPGKDLLWESLKGNMVRGRDVQRKRWDKKWWWRRAINEKEQSKSSARRRSRRGQSRLYEQELLPLINCRIIQRLLESGGGGGVWYYTSRQLTSFSPTLPRLRTISTLHATMTQAAHRDTKFIWKCSHAIFSPCLSRELLPAVSQLVSLTFLLIRPPTFTD